MNREQIERAAKNYFDGLDCPEPEKCAAFAIEQVNKALEEAADVAKKLYDLDWEDWPEAIRALKVKP